jgi:hypothetical protein
VRFIPAGIVFDGEERWSLTAEAAVGGFCLLPVAIHEIGHVLGLQARTPLNFTVLVIGYCIWLLVPWDLASLARPHGTAVSSADSLWIIQGVSPLAL